MAKRTTVIAFRIALIYFIFSAVWIFGSDSILSLLLKDVESFSYLSTIKGMMFVTLSSLIIFGLVSKEIKLYQSVEKRVYNLENYDLLTGVHNRVSFFKEVEKIYKNNQQISLFMTDINGLKVINEMYSSEVGDKLLMEYTSLLQELFPKNTFIARMGGDEFCVIVYECSYDKAVNYSKIVKDEIEKKQVKDLSWNISIGFSTTCDTKHNIYDSLLLSEERMMKDKLLKRESSSNSILQSLMATLYEKSDETEMHAERLKGLCLQLGERFKLTDIMLKDLTLLTLLHDIGKVGIDDSILKKPGPLTEYEYNKMKQHPVIGFNLASSIPQLEGVAYLILTHHERWDGTGYPNGLQGEQIPVHSRILSVVDAYDAMTNDRVYRKAMPKEHAIQEIIDNRGTQFDPNVVDEFLKIA